jgi:predicted lipoprotein with Yx(FWY)xxD motif/cytochrome c5
VRSTTLRRILWLLACTLGLLLGSALAEVMTASVDVVDHPDHGAHLVDGAGMSLYLFTRDEDGSSQCYGDCAAAWPPVLVDRQVAFGEGVDLGMLGATQREEGVLQLTFAGWPLYTFAEDQEPGSTTGHGRNGVWFLVAPTGEAIAADQVEETIEVEEPADDDPALDTADETGTADVDEAALMREGAQVYTAHCAACHGRGGDEAGGGAATLAGNRNLQNGPRTIRQVLFGGQYMPSFGDILSDHEVAAVVTHIRNSWGNDFGMTTEEEVEAVRQQFQ